MKKSVPQNLLSTYYRLEQDYKEKTVLECILENFKKYRDVEMVFDIANDDVKCILFSTGFITGDFDTAYATAVRIVRHTLTKHHLGGVIHFHALPSQEAIKWLLSRLANTVKSILVDSKNPHYIGRRVAVLEDLVDRKDCLEAIEIELDLERFSESEIEIGLRQVWKDALSEADFEWDDFVELCQKFNTNPYTLGLNENKGIVDRAGNLQLIFDFSKIDGEVEM